MLWMRPTEGNACSNAPAVLEFIADDDTSRAGVQVSVSKKPKEMGVEKRLEKYVVGTSKGRRESAFPLS